jgi:hypothetical protein
LWIHSPVNLSLDVVPAPLVQPEAPQLLDLHLGDAPFESSVLIELFHFVGIAEELFGGKSGIFQEPQHAIDLGNGKVNFYAT